MSKEPSRTNQAVKVLFGETLEGVEVTNIQKENGREFGYCEISGEAQRVVLTNEAWYYFPPVTIIINPTDSSLRTDTSTGVEGEFAIALKEVKALKQRITQLYRSAEENLPKEERTGLQALKDLEEALTWAEVTLRAGSLS